MKIIKVILFSLLALILIACAGIFIFLQVYDTDQYLPQISQKASLILGRQVSFGHLGLGFSQQGITLDAGPVIIADDPDITSEPFVKIDRVRISFDLDSLVHSRKFHITNILLQSPQIHFIRSEEGNINARSVGQVIKPNEDIIESPGAIGQSDTTKVPMLPDTHSSSPSFISKENDNIKSIMIQNASISFIDQSQGMPLDIWLRHINASFNDISLDLSKRSVQISDLKLLMDLSQLDSKDISPGVQDGSVLKNIRGLVRLNTSHLEITAGALEANGDIAVTGGVIKNFNIIKVLLSHAMGAFGSMGGRVDDLLGQLKDTLGANDTLIEKAEAKFSFHDRVLFIDDSLIKTNILELTAKGSMDERLKVDMQTMLHLNNDASDALINELDALKYLTDDSKRIAIGASLEGTIPHLKYKPNKNFRKKSKKAWIQEGGSILGALLGGR